VAEVSLDHGMTVVHVVVNEAMLMALQLPCLVLQHCPITSFACAANGGTLAAMQTISGACV
jgi:hypothetical protein